MRPLIVRFCVVRFFVVRFFVVRGLVMRFFIMRAPSSGPGRLAFNAAPLAPFIAGEETP